MSYTHKQLRDLEAQAIEDHRRGLLTRAQLLRIVHRLNDQLSEAFKSFNRFTIINKDVTND